MKKRKIIVSILALIMIPIITINAQDENIISSQAVENETSFTNDNKTYFLKLQNSQYYINSIIEDVPNGSVKKSYFNYKKQSNCIPTSIDTSSVQFENSFLNCSTLTKEEIFADKTYNYLLTSNNYSNGNLTTKNVYIRNSNKQITERRLYQYQNNINIKYTSYYGGKNFKTNKVNYNKTFVSTKNLKKQTTSVAYFELSQLWNEKKANVLKSYVTYSYHGNGKVKNKSVYYKSVSTNRYTKVIADQYRNNGKIAKRVMTNYYNTNRNSWAKRYILTYNKAGQLKSNRYGKAYRQTSTYKTNGKKFSSYKFQYNAYGKAKRIK